MATADRVSKKRKLVAERIREIADRSDMFIGILDEPALDLIILALGLGRMTVNEDGWE